MCALTCVVPVSSCNFSTVAPSFEAKGTSFDYFSRGKKIFHRTSLGCDMQHLSLPLCEVNLCEVLWNSTLYQLFLIISAVVQSSHISSQCHEKLFWWITDWGQGERKGKSVGGLSATSPQLLPRCNYVLSLETRNDPLPFPKIFPWKILWSLRMKILFPPSISFRRYGEIWRAHLYSMFVIILWHSQQGANKV